VQLLRIGRVEAPEVDQLARRVDLGLEGGLRLAEHRGRIERLPPRGCEQLGRAQKDRSAIFPCPVAPVHTRLARRDDRLLHVRW
jgi:hypothetical protein